MVNVKRGMLYMAIITLDWPAMWRVSALVVKKFRYLCIRSSEKMSANSSDQEDLPYINVMRKSPAVQAALKRRKIMPGEIIILDSPPGSSWERSVSPKSPVKSCNKSVEIIILDDSPPRACSIERMSSPPNHCRPQHICARTSPAPVTKKSGCDAVCRNTSPQLSSEKGNGEMPPIKKWKGKDSARERTTKSKAKLNLKEVDSDMEDILRTGGASSVWGPVKSGSKDGLHQVVVVLDRVLGESTDFMTEFLTRAMKLGVQYRVEDGYVPGSVRWVWSVAERDQDQAARTVERGKEKEVSRMLVTMDAPGFVGLVHYSKEVFCGIPLPAGSVSLEQYVSKLCADNPGIEISLAVQGMEAYRRGRKTRQNRQFRKCLESSSGGKGSRTSSKGKQKDKASSEEMFSGVSENDCEEAMIRLQLSSGCVVKICKTVAELASYVLCLTKSLCMDHKTDSPLSFYYENLQRPSKKDLYETDDKVCLLWKFMLKEFNDISMDMAAAVANVYPSPFLLLEAYKKCKTSKEKETLLKDIVVHRGVGVLASARKLGPVQSKRIYIMMTSSNPDALLR